MLHWVKIPFILLDSYVSPSSREFSLPDIHAEGMVFLVIPIWFFQIAQLMLNIEVLDLLLQFLIRDNKIIEIVLHFLAFP